MAPLILFSVRRCVSASCRRASAGISVQYALHWPYPTMTRGVHIMAEASVLPLTPSVKPSDELRIFDAGFDSSP